MISLEDLVDQVITAFDARRRTHWHATALPLTDADQELERWRGLVEARLKAFHHSVVDRDALLRRVRRRFEAAEWTADFAGVADELQEMAREDLRQHLTDNGLPEPSAQRIAAGYSIGALLHEP
jgi:hypothetical protein